MKFQSLTPNLMVEDVSKTLNYYEKILGFTTLRTIPEKGGVLDWGMMKRNDVVMMFQSRKSLADDLPAMQGRKPGGGMTLYIKMEGVPDLYNDLQDKVEIVADLEDTFYGTTEFSIIDLNGYVVTFAEDKEA